MLYKNSFIGQKRFIPCLFTVGIYISHNDLRIWENVFIYIQSIYIVLYQRIQKHIYRLPWHWPCMWPQPLPVAVLHRGELGPFMCKYNFSQANGHTYRQMGRQMQDKVTPMCPPRDTGDKRMISYWKIIFLILLIQFLHAVITSVPMNTYVACGWHFRSVSNERSDEWPKN